MAQDERKDPGSYYPGGRTGGGGGGGGGGELSNKVDRVTIGELGEDYSMDELKEKVNSIARAMAPVVGLLLVAALPAWGATARLGSLKASANVVTNEEDAAAIALVGSVTGTVAAAAIEASTNWSAAAIAAAVGPAATTNDLAEGIAGALEYTDAATNALAARIQPVDLTAYATKSWVSGLGYITETNLADYATRAWVSGLGYITSAALTNYATEAWVEGKGYLTEHQSLAGYATESWVEGKGYLTQHQSLSNYATRAWVEGKGYLTQHQSLADYARTSDLSRTEESLRAEIAQAAYASGTGNTVRLWRPDARGYLDGAGQLWSVTNVPPVPWSVTVTNENGGVVDPAVMGSTYAEMTWVSETDPQLYPQGPGWYMRLRNGLVNNTVFCTSWTNAEAAAAANIGTFNPGGGSVDVVVGGYAARVVGGWETNYVTRVAWTNELSGGGGGGEVPGNALLWAAGTVKTKDGSKTIGAADVGARAANWMPTATDVGALPVYNDIGTLRVTNVVSFSSPNKVYFGDPGIAVTSFSNVTAYSEGMNLYDALGAKQDKLPFPTNTIVTGTYVMGMWDITVANATTAQFDEDGGRLKDKQAKLTAAQLNVVNGGPYISASGGDLFGTLRISNMLGVTNLLTVSGYNGGRTILCGWGIDIDSTDGDRMAYLKLNGTNVATEAYAAAAAAAAISAGNPVFSNAVLSVGLGIDTNSVAVLNEIASSFGGFPLSPGETGTTVGGLLAALAAAIAWLKRNKLTKGMTDGVPDDPNVSALFSSANTSLNGAIDAELKADTHALTGAASGSVLARLTALETSVNTANADLEDALGGQG